MKNLPEAGIFKIEIPVIPDLKPTKFLEESIIFYPSNIIIPKQYLLNSHLLI